MDKETRAWTKKTAPAAAQKVCDTGACGGSQDCKACPIGKYNTKPTTGKCLTLPFWSRPDGDDLFALCAQCKNAAVESDGDEYWIFRKDTAVCTCCPVFIVENALEETASEAAYSGCE